MDADESFLGSFLMKNSCVASPAFHLIFVYDQIPAPVLVCQIKRFEPESGWRLSHLLLPYRVLPVVPVSSIDESVISDSFYRTPRTGLIFPQATVGRWAFSGMTITFWSKNPLNKQI